MRRSADIPVSIIGTQHVCKRDSSGSMSSIGSNESISIEGSTQLQPKSLVQKRRKTTRRRNSRGQNLVGAPVAIVAISSPEIDSMSKRIPGALHSLALKIPEGEEQNLCMEASRHANAIFSRDVLTEESSVSFADVVVESFEGRPKKSVAALDATVETGLPPEEMDWSVNSVNLHYSPLQADELNEIQESILGILSPSEHESVKPVAEHRRRNYNMLPSPEKLFDAISPLLEEVGPGKRRRSYCANPQEDAGDLRRRCFSEDKPNIQKGHRRNKQSIVLPPPVMNCW